MNTILVICKLLLGLLFVGVGMMKVLRPISELMLTLNWVADYSAFLVRALGIAEILIGILLVLPTLSKNIPDKISVFAALAVAIIMCGAIFVHLTRGEYPMIIMNLVLLIMSVFIMYQQRAAFVL